jgi:hypothetical protein
MATRARLTGALDRIVRESPSTVLVITRRSRAAKANEVPLACASARCSEAVDETAGLLELAVSSDSSRKFSRPSGMRAASVSDMEWPKPVRACHFSQAKALCNFSAVAAMSLTLARQIHLVRGMKSQFVEIFICYREGLLS